MPYFQYFAVIKALINILKEIIFLNLDINSKQKPRKSISGAFLYLQIVVDNKAQKEFMRYALLQKPKSALGKLVSEAWKKFKKWWDEKKGPEVEEKTRAIVRDKLASFKKQSEETKHDRPEPTRRRGMDIE